VIGSGFGASFSVEVDAAGLAVEAIQSQSAGMDSPVDSMTYMMLLLVRSPPKPRDDSQALLSI